MNKLMDWIKGKFMKYHISDKEYDMIHKDMQEENRNSLLFFSVITILFLFVMLLISFCSPHIIKCFLLKIQGFSTFHISVNKPQL